MRSIRFHPALAEELDSLVPARKRSAFIHQAVAAELKRLRRRMVREGTGNQAAESGTADEGETSQQARLELTEIERPAAAAA